MRIGYEGFSAILIGSIYRDRFQKIPQFLRILEKIYSKIELERE